ncbi:hypothetical protein CYLTODRAFT_36784 [Cylindrobasidium torrendii FP15055 ss-10]|uniref:Zn(2)-C6 fungal-type domain-containing protein n=1 Tax=Cylindrobasidium torrendii FP15055 ss-10 TaxID=1314674 RepID=A0A0D7BS69_9AGAR|nr:hypothetical protein CYLTODRAFT_36784 [Cylindrobasidium torrendii FP15055 ss-10]
MPKDTSSTDVQPKKRRAQGACDYCRTRKKKCDSSTMPGNICSSCLSLGEACTHVAADARRVSGGSFTLGILAERVSAVPSDSVFYEVHGPRFSAR